MAFLEVNNVSKRIENIDILSNVSLSFDSTGLVFIVGKSGAGKSTLMNIIGQLDHEYDGQIILENNLCKKNDSSLCEIRRSKIGFVFQDFNLLGDIKVYENIHLANRLAHSESVDILNLLDIFHIKNCADKECKVLSGGERQRVAIARAICKNSHIILADEPTGNLDQANAKQVFEVLKQISRERLVIVVSHDVDSAKQYGDRIISLSDGKVISDENIPSEKMYIENIEVKKTDNKITDSKNTFLPIIRQHLKNNRRRNTMVVVICSILLLFTSLVTSMVNAMQNVNSSINAVLGNDKITIFNSNEDEYLIHAISPEFIEDINAVGCNDVIGYHRMNIGTYNENDYISIKYDVYAYDDFFKERMGFYGLTLPENDKDIIINSVLAKSLFETTDCIGETFYLSAFGEEAVECTVFDVSDIMDEESPAMYIANSLIDDLYGKIADASSALLIRSASKMNYAFLNVNIYIDKDRLCYGRKPESNDEIVINAGGINSIISVLELPYASVSIDDVLDGHISDDIVEAVLDSKITLGTNFDDSLFEVTIVGITDNTDASLIVSRNSNGFNNMKIPDINMLDIYLSNRTENMESIEKLVNKYGYSLIDDGGAKAGLIASRISVPVTIICMLSIIAFILAFLFIKLTTKINIMNHTQEIGILKALGASDRQVKSIYLKENLILFLCSLIPTIIIVILLQLLSVKGLMIYEGIKVYSLNVGYFFAVCFMGVVTILIASIAEVGKVAKMNLVDILRKSN